MPREVRLSSESIAAQDDLLFETSCKFQLCHAQYVCVPQRKLVPVPMGLDAAEAVAVVLNYITAYQMLHRLAKAQPGQRMLILGASGGVGSAMLQLAKLAASRCMARARRWGH